MRRYILEGGLSFSRWIFNHAENNWRLKNKTCLFVIIKNIVLCRALSCHTVLHAHCLCWLAQHTHTGVWPLHTHLVFALPVDLQTQFCSSGSSLLWQSKSLKTRCKLSESRGLLRWLPRCCDSLNVAIRECPKSLIWLRLRGMHVPLSYRIWNERPAQIEKPTLRHI